MTGAGVHPERIATLNRVARRRGSYVLYWMQQSQRTTWNHALEFAAADACEARLPLLVCFGLTGDYPEANLRHYRFLLEGLAETAASLQERGIGFVLRRGDPPAVALDLAADAALIVCDRGWTRIQRAWRETVVREAPCPVVEVETDIVAPVESVADRALYSAHSLRARIRRRLPEFLGEVSALTPVIRCADAPAGEDVADVPRLLEALKVDPAVPPVSHFFRGGAAEAERRLAAFIGDFPGYAADRSRPETDHGSHLSKYLHFGQISPVEIARRVGSAEATADDVEAFLDELIVRRELAHNWVWFRPDYDRYAALPEWARKTLAAHAADHRDPCYTLRELERAETHDRYWNAAMREMLYTGSMHNKMRMYWGKKILEWSPAPEEAFARTLSLNNRYFLDGRDANSFANVGWIFGLHDRPWGERPIYGTVRSMVAGGLERKSDIGAYVERIDRLVEEARAQGIRYAWETVEGVTAAVSR